MTSQDRTSVVRDSLGDGAAGFERELRRLVPASVPSGLRERVLERAAATRRGAALAPWMRIATAACAVLIGALVALDPVLVRHDQARLAALLDGHSVSTTVPETASELAEAGLGPEEARRSRLQGLAAAAARKPQERASIENLERLKGWWEYEDPQDPY